jgi:hypothetical protein
MLNKVILLLSLIFMVFANTPEPAENTTVESSPLPTRPTSSTPSTPSKPRSYPSTPSPTTSKKVTRPAAPKSAPTIPNRIQYHTHIGNQSIGSKEWEYVCEVGFANPTGYKVGDTIIITGRTDLRTGTEESTEFLNRNTGHKVLFVEDYKHNDDGNGGRIFIEGHPTTEEHRVGGNKNEHTFDGAHAVRK